MVRLGTPYICFSEPKDILPSLLCEYYPELIDDTFYFYIDTSLNDLYHYSRKQPGKTFRQYVLEGPDEDAHFIRMHSQLKFSPSLLKSVTLRAMATAHDYSLHSSFSTQFQESFLYDVSRKKRHQFEKRIDYNLIDHAGIAHLLNYASSMDEFGFKRYGMSDQQILELAHQGMAELNIDLLESEIKSYAQFRN